MEYYNIIIKTSAILDTEARGFDEGLPYLIKYLAKIFL
jgi:hypothetical protein